MKEKGTGTQMGLRWDEEEDLLDPETGLNDQWLYH